MGIATASSLLKMFVLTLIIVGRWMMIAETMNLNYIGVIVIEGEEWWSLDTCFWMER